MCEYFLLLNYRIQHYSIILFFVHSMSVNGHQRQCRAHSQAAGMPGDRGTAKYRVAGARYHQVLREPHLP